MSGAKVYLPFLLALFFIAACTKFVMDPSMESIAAGDYTLLASACDAVPGRGMDVCHVKEGTKIESAWTLLVPGLGKNILGGEIDVYYKDIHHTYAVTGNKIQIPWADFFKSSTWSREFDGEALALVLIRFETPEGIEEVIKFRGIAKLVVTAKGYERLPIDSGYTAWKKTCKIAYSTAGRSAISCK